MKYLVVVCVFCALFSPKECMTDALNEEILKIHEKCQPTSEVNDMVNRAMTGDFSDDPAFKNHLLCIAKGMGLFTESGEVIMEKVESELDRSITNEALKSEIKSKCLQQLSSPQDTVFNAVKCMFGYKDQV